MTGNAGITRIPKEIIQSIAPNRVIFSATAPEITEDMELDTVWINTDNMYEYNIFPVEGGHKFWAQLGIYSEQI